MMVWCSMQPAQPILMQGFRWLSDLCQWSAQQVGITDVGRSIRWCRLYCMPKTCCQLTRCKLALSASPENPKISCPL